MTIEETAPAPSPIKKRSLLEDHAREKCGMPDAWEMYRWQLQPVGSLESKFVNVSGAVCEAVYLSGKRKGFKNWSKRDSKTDCTVSIPNAEHDAWLISWEKKTGNCHVCQGDGQEWSGWSVTDGNRYKPCRRCSATGKTSP